MFNPDPNTIGEPIPESVADSKYSARDGNSTDNNSNDIKSSGGEGHVIKRIVA